MNVKHLDHSISPLLALPVEILDRIYQFALPSQCLAVQKFKDPSFSQAQRPSGIPNLFLVSRQVYRHAAPIFYSQAILNVAPICRSDNPGSSGIRVWSSPLLDRGAGDLDLTFASCNPDYLSKIAVVNIFSGQLTAVDVCSYETLLRWLINRTAVRSIHLSQRLMTRVMRAERVDLYTAVSHANTVHPRPVESTVYIYSSYKQTTWEIFRTANFRRILKQLQLPRLQCYLYSSGTNHDPILDPRWDVRQSDTDERMAVVRQVAEFLDALIAADAQCCRPPDDTTTNRLYQVVFVLKPPLA
ncbi:hypothetical protein B0A52_08321 [Exophiala mesophila]|uniref:F-box domain-containing protein n=1 Tax=Exophiala mesophila TaxID=212818 RepID=A0A438MVY4_EXOME|nr:hypothetical protein B0A52_08321 [Exophiala mesophila]